MRAVALWLVVCGCRIGFDPLPGGAGSDGGGGGGGGGDAAHASCASSYSFSYGSSRYRYAGTDQWRNSELDCESDGAGMHLVVVDDAAELAAIASLPGATTTWVGTSDRITAGTWRLVTGPVATYLPWAASQPAALPCVSWNPATGMFAAEDCAQARGRVCECDGVAVDKTSY